MIEPREAEKMAADMDALLTELGGPEEIQELDVQRFVHQLDEEDEEAERVVARIGALSQYHRTSGLLLEAWMAALTMGNMPLARHCFAGIQALVHQARAEASEAGEEAE